VLTLTAEDYRLVFAKERQNVYPVVDAFEQKCGYWLDKGKVEMAAKVLACPIKKNPPNWQHGRVLYAAARAYLSHDAGISVLDIGTAKGFSALCLQWALEDSESIGLVTSVDIIDPTARVVRNTIAEVDGPVTLAETLAPWPEASQIRFVQSEGLDWLRNHPERIHIAFVDGSHHAETVWKEGLYLADRQEPGDLAIFDDIDRVDITAAVASLKHKYRFEYLEVLPNRHYAIGVRQ
jgi:predicted O-methyltransferase YrrM